MDAKSTPKTNRLSFCLCYFLLSMIRLISKLVLDSAHLLLRRSRMDRPEIRWIDLAGRSTSQTAPLQMRPTYQYSICNIHIINHLTILLLIQTTSIMYDRLMLKFVPHHLYQPLSKYFCPLYLQYQADLYHLAPWRKHYQLHSQRRRT